MNADEALNQVEHLLIARSLPTLPYPQSAIFKGAWDGLTYEEISDQPRKRYEVSYIRELGAELCKQLSEVLGVKVRKPTFQEDVIEGLERRSCQNPEPQPNFTQLYPTFTPLAPVPALDSAEVRWVGREDLVERLVQRLLGDCRLLMLVGLTGIGKTALAARLLTDRVLHPTLPIQKVLALDHTLPNFEHLASEILGAAAIADADLQNNSDKLIAAMVARLKTQPCLLVLDMVEEILTRDRPGTTRFTEPAFDRFLEQVIRADTMPSRVILTSQERPPSLYQGRHAGRVSTSPCPGSLPRIHSLQVGWHKRLPAFWLRLELLLRRPNSAVNPLDGHRGSVRLRVLAIPRSKNAPLLFVRSKSQKVRTIPYGT